MSRGEIIAAPVDFSGYARSDKSYFLSEIQESSLKVVRRNSRF